MTIIAIPNVSEGRNGARIRAMTNVVDMGGSRILDLHSDAHHNRTVLTVAGEQDVLVRSMTLLADEASLIDVSRHEGVHPRVGGLDVCPFVPVDESIDRAVEMALVEAEAISTTIELPVYLYGAASNRGLELPEIRRGGLGRLIERATADLPPDRGPQTINPRKGVVCVGARDTLIAFNIWIEADAEKAEKIAAKLRTTGGGPPEVRALGMEIEPGRSQISMNLTDPATTGIEDVYRAVDWLAADEGAAIYATEIVGLVPERFLPGTNTQAARLLIEPGRSLEQALKT
jgi:glutamate formiminotransferase